MASEASEPTSHPEQHGHAKGHFWGLTIASVGVVFGDIGTSPLYAMRETLARTEGDPELAVLGVVSLITWALIIVVTIKYVLFLMRADNNGEGGTLALMALARRSVTKGTRAILFLGLIGAALFYGDAVITPAVTVMSAVEGLTAAPGIGPSLKPFVLPIAAGIIIALFAVQSRGTASVGKFFGPICTLWFLTLGGLGLIHIFDDLSIFRGLSPHYGIAYLSSHGFAGFLILGGVFLAVTGTEALYADMGHFGKKPIQTAWIVICLPCLLINYFGQGAFVLSNPEARANPFFEMIPHIAYWPVLILATCAAVVASQAVITGAFSITQQAVQLGLFPRLDIRRTSEKVAGQIFVPNVNTGLLIGVLVLIFAFGSSSALTTAYGVAVAGAMLVDSLLFFVAIRWFWKKPMWMALTGAGAFALIDLGFLIPNLFKIPQGAWVALVVAGVLVFLMWTWIKGTRILAEKTRKDSIPLNDLIDILKARAPHRVPGTAIFLTSDVDVTPVALMHNLKHNKVLHEKNIILTVKTAETPRVPDGERVVIEPISDDFKKVVLIYGFMENPNVPKALAAMRKSQGLKFDIMATSFFLGRRSIVAAASGQMPLWQDKLYIFLMKNAANPTDFFRIPPGRVVELGAQVTV